jgi:hypothetical protein
MLNLKSIPTGIDIPIQLFQSWMYQKLKPLWNLDDVNFESYGKIYRNKTEAGYIPEVFVSSLSSNNTVYKEAFFDQSIHKVVSFFQVDPERKFENCDIKANVSLYFIINGQKVKSTPWRASEEIKNDLYQLSHVPKYGMVLTGSESGFKLIFRDFDGWITNDTLTYLDIEPYYCFKLMYTVAYNIFD